MKHILSFLILVLVLFSSCEDELDLTPISQKTESSFYNTSEQLEQAIFGCYDGLQQTKVNSHFSFMMSESRSDNTWQGPQYDDGAFSRFNENATSPTLLKAWNTLYNSIQRCNKVLEAIDKIKEVDETLKKQWKGEAIFIRSLLYFDLVRYFGSVPIVTSSLSVEEAYNTPDATIEEVYDLIRDDLLTIINENLLNAKIIPGRANIYSAKALLGKVYVYRSGYPLNTNEWDKAADMLNDVITSGEFEFVENYADIFAYENENGKQSVFSIKFVDGNDEGNEFPTRNAPNSISPDDFEFGGSPYRLQIDQEFVEKIFPEQEDLRKNVALRTSWLNKTNIIETEKPWCRKYAEYNDEINGPVSAPYNWNVDYIVIRYTDVLMLYAEALNELEGPNGAALQIINDVRQRAGLQPIATTNKEAFKLVLEQERRSEFCFENQRWFDLVRTDRALPVMQEFLGNQGDVFASNFVDREKYYFPIPQSVLDLRGTK